MSTRNRQKRAAKQKNRRRAGARKERVGFDPGPDRIPPLARLVMALSEAATCSDDQAARRSEELLDQYGDSLNDLDAAADIAVHEAIRAAWEHGWTPRDLHEIARRRLEADGVGYLDQAMVLESRRYPADSLHPKWRDGLPAISGMVVNTSRAPQMWRWAASNSMHRREALTVVVKLLTFLGRLPVIAVLLPLPGSHRHTATGAAQVDGTVLGKVRALLAKAEATEFPKEAEAFSAKAQELMTRYSLEEAVAQHDRGGTPVAAARRIWIDAPYAAAKVSLVQAVGQANRCRAVWAQRLGFVTVIGSETDLDLVELLSTSLLVQATRALLAAGRGNSGEQARTRSFRQSFLLAYAQRIGERLDTTSVSVRTEIEQAGRLLPVLAATSRAADALADRLFPSTVSRPVSAANSAGWGAGRAAADMARLGVRHELAG